MDRHHDAASARALELGFRAVKMEVLFDDLAERPRARGLHPRGAGASSATTSKLLVDFGYRWRDWRDALWVLPRASRCERLYLAEATLPARRPREPRAAGRRGSRPRVGGAELASTWEECRAWLERRTRRRAAARRGPGRRPDGAAPHLPDRAAERGALVIPHCWKTGIDAAAARHLQAASAEVPLIETLVPELWTAPLRDGLVAPEPPVVDGRIELPTAPGLGVELQRNVVARYTVG